MLESPSETEKSLPSGLQSLTPHLVCERASEAIEFYKRAFDAKELSRLPGSDGRLMHAALQIGNSTLMLVDEMPEWHLLGAKTIGKSPVTIQLYVTDVDAVFAQAIAAGATVKMPVSDMFWGDRYGQLVDPFGHSWSVATQLRKLTPEQLREAMKEHMSD